MPFLLNQDLSDFALGHPGEKLNREELLKQIDLYETGGDCTVILNGNAQKTAYDSAVFESSWNGVDIHDDGKMFYRGKELPAPFDRITREVKQLFENVNDLFEVRIAHCRKNGYPIFLSMRMNDVHWVHDFDNVLVSDFWREHQDCLVTDYTDKEPWCYKTFDYAKKEVYDYHLALVREYLTRFDPDGLELDWMRTPYYFKPGWEVENAEILTKFLRDTRKIADECEIRKGHRIELIVRVPSRPEDARRMGFDVPAWGREKLIDRIIPTSYWGVTDFDIPLELWRSILGNDIKITACLEIMCRCTPYDKMDFTNDAAVVFGFASSYYYRGSDDIYLFNHMDETGTATGMKKTDDFRLVLQMLGKRECVEKQKRRHVVTFTDFLARAAGFAMDHILPLTIEGSWKFLRLNLGGSVKGRDAKLVISCENGLPDEIRCGGVICQKTEERFTDQLPGTVKDPVVYSIPDEALKEGDNILSFKGNGQKLLWCEINLKKL